MRHINVVGYAGLCIAVSTLSNLFRVIKAVSRAGKVLKDMERPQRRDDGRVKRMEPIILDIGKEEPMIKKPFYRSSTTQTIAGSVVGSATIGWAVVRAMRMFVPQYVIWTEAEDATVANILTVVLTPILSRVIAIIRKGVI